MIERIARVLCDEHFRVWDKLPEKHEFDDCRENYREWARAVLTAMREPTEAMIKAGNEGDLEHGPPVAKDCWQAMIDEALKPD